MKNILRALANLLNQMADADESMPPATTDERYSPGAAQTKHVYCCGYCDRPLTMYLNHCGGKRAWTQESGCGEDCPGTFQHPESPCGRSTVGHNIAYLRRSYD